MIFIINEQLSCRVLLLHIIFSRHLVFSIEHQNKGKQPESTFLKGTKSTICLICTKIVKMTICHDIHVDILRSKHISQPIKLETKYSSEYVLHETLRKENKSPLYFAHVPP